MCFSYTGHMPYTEHTCQSTPLAPNFILSPLSRIPFLPIFTLKNPVHPSKASHMPLLPENLLNSSFSFPNQIEDVIPRFFILFFLCLLPLFLLPFSPLHPLSLPLLPMQWPRVFYLLCGTNGYRLL